MEGAYPLPAFIPFQNPSPLDTTLLSSGLDINVPSIEPFIAANLILAPNPWCLQPPAAYYKYPSRLESSTNAASTQQDAAGEDDAEVEDRDETSEVPDTDAFFGAEYLNIPMTAKSAHFPTNEIVGEKRKRADNEEQEEGVSSSEDELPTSSEPDGPEITWEEGTTRRGRGRPKGSKDSQPRDTSRTHRYRSLHSGAFVARDHVDAVLDSPVKDDHEMISDSAVLRTKVLQLAGKFYADLACVLDRSTAETVAECLDADREISDILNSVQRVSTKITGQSASKPDVSPSLAATPVIPGQSSSEMTTPLAGTDVHSALTTPSATPIHSNVMSEIVLIPSVIEALVNPVRAV